MADDDVDLEAYRQRAREWLAATVPALVDGADPFDEMTEADAVDHARRLQRQLFDGGYAGIVFPREYAGQGLTPAHQRCFTSEASRYQSPLRFNMSTVAIIAPTLLEFGTEEQKRDHIPAILRGDELWAQLLSEPTGGSDLAGAVTTATRDGDTWILRGAKTWTSGGHLRDRGLCLARTDWDAAKHRGLSMFVVDLHQPGVTVRPIRQANGAAEFCEEFFDDVELPTEALVGQEGDGWSVASRMLFHERSAVGGSTIYAARITGRRRGVGGSRRQADLVARARAAGSADDDLVRQQIAEAHVLTTVRAHLIGRVTTGIRTGALPGSAAAITKLFTATAAARIATIAMEVAGADGVVGGSSDATVAPGVYYLVRQAMSIGGGTNEMQRNNISERVLGMPRERSEDRDRPFSEVRQNRLPPR
ncbi:MAG TPA: acyl-CoA dehydrogenase family protein [Acidimicrobiales bacterium]|nr:acyl-CoA dehydrogenase family protein [Acidimicrobiales bacterium]